MPSFHPLRPLNILRCTTPESHYSSRYVQTCPASSWERRARAFVTGPAMLSRTPNSESKRRTLTAQRQYNDQKHKGESRLTQVQRMCHTSGKAGRRTPEPEWIMHLLRFWRRLRRLRQPRARCGRRALQQLSVCHAQQCWGKRDVVRGGVGEKGFLAFLFFAFGGFAAEPKSGAESHSVSPIRDANWCRPGRVCGAPSHPTRMEV
jgi:hypothetical protein